MVFVELLYLLVIVLQSVFQIRSAEFSVSSPILESDFLLVRSDTAITFVSRSSTRAEIDEILFVFLNARFPLLKIKVRVKSLSEGAFARFLRFPSFFILAMILSFETVLARPSLL